VSEQGRNLVYESGQLRVHLGRRELLANGVAVPVGARAFEIVEVLVRSANDLVTKDDLMDRIWPGAMVGENTLQVHISAIRKALGSRRSMLKTESGRGYRLVGSWTARPDNARTNPVDVATAPVSPAPVAGEPVQGNLPIAVSNLIGRDAVLRKVRDLMSAYRIVTLTGAGGIGKTTLGLEAARLASPEFEGDVWVIELATLTDPGLVSVTVASVLGLDLATASSSDALARAIGGRTLLLVFDNCEHVVDAAARVVESVIRLCPNASVLATSREALRIEGECAYRVPPLDFPVRYLDRVLSASEQDHVLEHSAVQLFIARMTERQLDGTPKDDLAAVAAICGRLDGIPLAIEFAAARAAALGVDQVLSRLDDRFNILISGRRTALPKHQTLRATLDWSYQLLSDSERLLLRNLAVFAAAFSLEAASAVTRNGEVTDADIAEGVENLVAKSLVTTDSSVAVERFRLLETTRAYALERLMEVAGARQIARRHAEYYRGFLERIENEQETRPVSQADLGNVRAALEWCFAANGDTEVGIGLAAAAAPAFFAMSLLTECHRWSERALLALDDASRGGGLGERPGGRPGGREEMELQAALGISLFFTHGSTEAAREALSRGLVIAEERGDARTQVRLLGPLVIFHVRFGDFNAAMLYSKRASAISDTLTDPDALALAHCCAGMSFLHAGELVDARLQLEAAVKDRLSSSHKSISYFGFDYYSLAGVSLAQTLWFLGHPAQAVDQAQQIIRHAAALNHPVTLSFTLHWAIPVYLLTGDLQTAEAHTDWLISRAEAHSLLPYIAMGRGFKGELDVRRGNPTAGVEKLQVCLAGLFATRHELLITPFSISLAQGLAAIGRFTEAVTLIDERIRLAGINGNISHLPELLRMKGALLLAMPDPGGDVAEKCFVQSLEVSRLQGALGWELRTAVDLAALLTSRGEAESARTLLRQVLERFVDGLETSDVQAATRLLAILT
jgi:predicted ATPase/DNA-binding winged helix-turn-helix (wHTH) protein